jgi:hypothetical protein
VLLYNNKNRHSRISDDNTTSGLAKVDRQRNRQE